MADLTPRQTDILKTIILEYTDNGTAVGSEILDKKYNLGVSPATVRNEMITLAKKGYLKKQHFSSGRVPTAQAFRFYIQNIMKEKELSTAEEVSYRSGVWDYRNQINQLLQNATRVLAKKTGLLALSTTNLGDVYYFGVTNVLHQKEFWDIDLACDFFEKLDEVAFFEGILEKMRKVDESLIFLLGDENMQDAKLEDCASVFGEFEGVKIKGAIGVMGPKRMHYDTVVPNVKYFTGLIQEIISEQGL